MSQKAWAHDLLAGIAAALGATDPPELIDEALLARLLRQCAFDNDDLGQSLFLRSLADAFDHPDAERPIRFARVKRGRPPKRQARFERAMLVGPFVTEQLIAGIKKEAAIQQAMSQFGLSRSAVMRAQTEYEDYRRVFDPSRSDSPTRLRMHDFQLILDRELAARRLQFKKGEI